jgi:hypothetical protein
MSYRLVEEQKTSGDEESDDATTSPGLLDTQHALQDASLWLRETQE